MRCTRQMMTKKVTGVDSFIGAGPLLTDLAAIMN